MKASEIVIVTHNNQFHMDDVIACFMLRQIYPYSTIVRTREREKMEKGDFVVDVGDEYAPERKRYDHHQRTFNVKYDEKYPSKMSSAGLVFKHYGEEFLAAIGVSLAQHKEIVIKQIYEDYFLPVDANDNGVDISDAPKYKERSLEDVVRSLNPVSFDKSASYEEQEAERLRCFHNAMEFMGSDLVRFCKKVEHDTRRAAELLQKDWALLGDKEYLVLSQNYTASSLVPYYNEKYQKNVKILIYPKKTQNGTEYSIMCLPKRHVKYSPQAPLCARWRGLREKELSREPGLEDANFVHATGFCGSAKSLETAKRMAEGALKENYES